MWHMNSKLQQITNKSDITPTNKTWRQEYGLINQLVVILLSSVVRTSKSTALYLLGTSSSS